MKQHLGLSFVVLLLAASVRESAAQTSSVTNCTEAALEAALIGGGTVTFACDGTIDVGQSLTIAVDTVLDATGHQITISGGNRVRVFVVASKASLSLLSLTIVNGSASDGLGGGILNAGGSLNATNCTFSGNLAANTPDGPSRGGAILNLSGQVNLQGCTFAGNSARASNQDAAGTLTNYDVAGGAVYSDGSLAVSRCTFIGNSALGRSDPWSAPNATPIGVASGALGGALCNLGAMSVTDSAFASNSVTGGCGLAGTGQPGGPGTGGALFYSAGGIVSGCTFFWNTATGGLGSPGRPGQIFFGNGGNGAGGGAGSGGALSAAVETRIVNCTFAWNAGIGGAGGQGGDAYPWPPDHSMFDGGNGGSGGFGVGAVSGQCFLTNCTLAFNSGIGGAGGWGGAGGIRGTSGSPGGGEVLSGTLLNSLVAGNLPAGGFTNAVLDAVSNLWSDSAFGIIGPIADNGGPTLTMALLPGSPAIDAANSALAPPIDQRGFPRPFGAAAEIGACEYGSWPVLRISPPGVATPMTISVQGTSGQPCRLLTSTEFSAWVPVATNTIGSDGTVTLSLQPDTDGQRFYRVVSP